MKCCFRYTYNMDVYMCISHIPPEGSTYGINVLESIENDVILYRDKDHIILCGDINLDLNVKKIYQGVVSLCHKMLYLH
jgi:hypothetical protein